jgi:hypothetical protein
LQRFSVRSSASRRAERESMAQGPIVAVGEPWRLVSWPGSVCVGHQYRVFVKRVRGTTHRHVI